MKIRQAFQRLGSPDAISWIAVVSTSLQGFIGAFAAPQVDIDGRFGMFALDRFAGVVVFALAMGVGKLILLRYAKERPRPFITLSVFVVAGVLDIVIYDGLLIATGFSDSWNLLRRLAVSIPGKFTILIVSALLVVYARDFSQRNRALATVIDNLVETRNSASGRIAERRQQLAMTIERQVSADLARLGRESASESITRMTRLIDDVVRPMSYELARDIVAVEPAKTTMPTAGISWRAIVNRALLVSPAHPVATTVWLGLLVGVFLATGHGIQGVGGAVAFAIPNLVLLTLINVGWKRALPTSNIWIRATLLSAFFVLVSVSVLPGMTWVGGYDFLRLDRAIGWTVLSVLMMWTISLVYATNENLRETNQRLELAADELRREVVLLNNQYRRMQKNLSRVLHGPIQEAISAALLHLKSHSANDVELTREFTTRIRVALSSLDTDQENRVNVQTMLDDLAELWDGVTLISVDMHESDAVRLSADSLAGPTVIELIREACGNAVRHGGAERIDVTLRLDEKEGLAIVIVDNNGAPLSESSPHTSGLGTDLFDELTLRWTREQVGSLVRVEAVIPLSSD